MHRRSSLVPALAFLAAGLGGCSKEEQAPPPQPLQVTAVSMTPQDTPVSFEFVAQTESSRAVEIRARVDGFLDKRLYTEGGMVHAGQPLFQMDAKPFQAALQSAQGQLEQERAKLDTAEANLRRVRPLAARNAVSKRELDDAVGVERSARAAVLAAEGQVRTASLNLGYTTINSPLRGLSSFAKRQEGSYLTAGEQGLLTTIYQLDPIWVNFSISENQLLSYRDQIAKGRLKFPSGDNFEVEVVLADGTVFPQRGHISFAAPSFNSETGTFLVRTELPNPKGQLRPGQFVRARVFGATRPAALRLPQRAVQDGAKGHFVWVIGEDGKAKQRAVEVGDWIGDDWFISAGLKAGERVVVDGAGRVTPTAPLRVAQMGQTPALASAGNGGNAAAASVRPASMRAGAQQ